MKSLLSEGDAKTADKEHLHLSATHRQYGYQGNII